MERKWLYTLAIVVVVIVAVGTVYYFETTQTPKAGSGTPVALYVGEVNATAYGFGNTSTGLTSNPGPTITLTAGQTYTMTLHNVGTMQHNWAIVNAKATSATVLWGAVISPVNPGASGQVTFKAGSAGSYYYICQVPGHVSLGLWGTIIVNS